MLFRQLGLFLLVSILLYTRPVHAEWFPWDWNKKENAQPLMQQVDPVPAIEAPEEIAPLPMMQDHPHPPRLVVIIDDMGVDFRRSARAIDLPPGVTLSFLPYARHVKEQVEKARIKGHHLMLHLPMQADDPSQNPGPNALRVSDDDRTLMEYLDKNLNSFQGYTAVNNHMGSRFTQYPAGMRKVMHALKERYLFFVDSKTSPQSVSADAAQKEGVPVIARDIFLDHVNDPAHIAHALEATERLLARKGHAVVIGHPKDNTLSALEKWLPTLKSKGIALVPVTDMRELAP